MQSSPKALAALDTLVRVETPEGLQLTLRPAGVTPRLYAWLIDWAIRAAAISVLGSALSKVEGIGTGLLLIVYFLLEWFYPVFFELRAAGATPGKRLLHLQVIMDDGLPVTPAASVLRNLLRAADFLPFAFGFGALTMLCRRDFKRLGDLVAGTLVVYRVKGDSNATLPPGLPLAPTQNLSLPAQVAVIDLAMRAARLTPARVEELAGLVPEPLLPAAADASRSQRIFALARWLMGHR